MYLMITDLNYDKQRRLLNDAISNNSYAAGLLKKYESGKARTFS